MRSTPRLFLSFIFIHYLVSRPYASISLFSLIHSCAARRDVRELCVFHSRSLLHTFSLVVDYNKHPPSVSVARPRSFLPSPSPPRVSVSVSSAVPFVSFFNLRIQCTATRRRGTTARAEGVRRQKHAARPCLTRSVRPHGLWRFFVERERVVVVLFLIAGCRGVVNCSGAPRGRPRTHVPDVIFYFTSLSSVIIHSWRSCVSHMRGCVHARARPCELWRVV